MRMIVVMMSAKRFSQAVAPASGRLGFLVERRAPFDVDELDLEAQVMRRKLGISVEHDRLVVHRHNARPARAARHVELDVLAHGQLVSMGKARLGDGDDR